MCQLCYVQILKNNVKKQAKMNEWMNTIHPRTCWGNRQVMIKLKAHQYFQVIKSSIKMMAGVKVQNKHNYHNNYLK